MWMENNDTSAATSPLPAVPIYASDIEMLCEGHIQQTLVPLILDCLHSFSGQADVFKSALVDEPHLRVLCLQYVVLA
jgi:hypothetical protein